MHFAASSSFSQSSPFTETPPPMTVCSATHDEKLGPILSLGSIFQSSGMATRTVTGVPFSAGATKTSSLEDPGAAGATEGAVEAAIEGAIEALALSAASVEPLGRGALHAVANDAANVAAGAHTPATSNHVFF